MCDVLISDGLEPSSAFISDRKDLQNVSNVKASPITFHCGDSDEDEQKPDQFPVLRDTNETSHSQPLSDDSHHRKCSAPASVTIQTMDGQTNDSSLSTSFTYLYGSRPSDSLRDTSLPFDAATSAPHSLYCLEVSASKSIDGKITNMPSLRNRVSSGNQLSLTSQSTRSSGRRLSGWYYSLAPSYKSKLEQFRRIFRGTPVDTERLLVDYSCALSKNNHGLLQQGRMYITESWVCFYSKILSEQKIYLAVKEIIAITKEKTARVIPNAIQIIYSKNHQRFFFTSFSSRERTYAILRKVWDNCRNNQTMSIDEIVQQVREIYGDDSLAMLEDEDTDGDAGLPPNSFHSRARTTSESSDLNLLSADGANDSNAANYLWGSDDGANQSVGLSGFGTTDDEFNDDGLQQDRSTNLSAHAPPETVESGIGIHRQCHTPDLQLSVADSGATETDPPVHETHSAEHLLVKTERKKRSKKRAPRAQHSASPIVPQPHSLFPSTMTNEDANSSVTCLPGHDHPGQLYADALIPLSVDALFACIFTDSVFFDRLTTSRGTFGMVQSSWPTLNWSKQNDELANTERTIRYTLKLNQKLGPRTCAAVEQQVLLVNESQPGRCYVVDAKVTNQAVPLCNCFCVVSRYCLLRVDRVNSRLRVSSRVVYEKPVFFGAKSIIENTCRSGLTDFFTALIAHLTEMASSLTEEERLTGGPMSIQSTSTAISHNGVRAKPSSKLTDRPGSVHDNTCGKPNIGVGHKRSRDTTSLNPISSASPTHKSHAKSSSSPGSANPVFLNQTTPLGEIGYFFLRPDRAWLLLVVISLLLCLCLSMVYNRLVALEHLAEQLSDTHSSAKFMGPNMMDRVTPFTRSSSFEASHARLRVMKELTVSMAKTLNQMQEVLAEVHRSIELLDRSSTSNSQHTPLTRTEDGPTVDSSSCPVDNTCQPT